MAITHAMTVSFKSDCLKANIDFDTDTFKMALYTDAANLDATTTAYTATGEVVGAGYIAGGMTLTGVTVATSGVVAYVDFDNPEWTSASFTARGALIYRAGSGDPSVGVIDFGENKTVSSGTFRVDIPPATASTAIVRYE